MNFVLLANWTVFFPIAVCLLVAMRLTLGPVDSGSPNFYRVLSTTLARLLLYVSIAGICCRFGPFGMLWLVVVSVMLIVLAVKNRELIRSAFQLTLFNCVDQPSAAMALATSFEAENQGWLRRRSKRMRTHLQRTGDWGRAVESAGLVRGARHKLALRLFSRFGKPGLLRREIQLGDAAESIIDSLLGRLLVATFSGWALIVCALISTFIVPTFVKMLQEFGIEAPIGIAWMEDHSAIISIVGVMVPLILTWTVGIVMILYLFPNLLVFPPFVWFFGSYYRALTFLGLAEIVDDALPMNETLRKLAAIHPVPGESNKLFNVARKLERGTAIKDALRGAWLVNSQESSLLELSMAQHNASWTFRQLGEIGVERCFRRFSIIVQIVVVVLVLTQAVIVGAIGVGFFSVLARLVHSLA